MIDFCLVWAGTTLSTKGGEYLIKNKEKDGEEIKSTNPLLYTTMTYGLLWVILM